MVDRRPQCIHRVPAYDIGERPRLPRGEIAEREVDGDGDEAVLALIVVELGLITPPVGLNVFIISSLDQETPMAETFRGVVPFLLVELVRVTLVLLVPALALTLPALLGR